MNHSFAENQLRISASPHLHASKTTGRIMLDVCFALLPACGMGIYAFGISAFLVLFCSVSSCVLTEFLFALVRRKPQTVGDCSAIVTGLLLGMNLPSTVPLFVPILGGVFAMAVVKLLFGGLGQNFMNPALAARCFLLLSFTQLMTTFPSAFRTVFAAQDAVSGATPLAAYQPGQEIDLFRLFFDTHNGCIGETSPIAILLGALYLLVRRVITPRIPVIYMGTTIGFIALIQVINGNAAQLTLSYFLVQLCGGGLLLGACFMANDYTTAPITPWGQVVYAILLGLLTALFRVLGSSAEGVSYAIIIGNCVSPLIESFTRPKPFSARPVKEDKREKGGKQT